MKVLYSQSQDDFFADVRGNVFADKLAEGARACGLFPGESEIRSWENNAPMVKSLLESSSGPGTQVSFETCLPYNQSRIDCMIYGHGADDAENVVHIELKQWSNEGVNPADCDANFYVEAYTGGARRVVPHPSQQVRGYDDYLSNFIDVISRREVNLAGFAYCYNYRREGETDNALFDSRYGDLLKEFRTYAKNDVADLTRDLRRLLCNGDGLSIFNKVQKSPIRPSKKLLEEAAGLVHDGNIAAFALLDDQIVARNAIRKRVLDARKTGRKSIVIVNGGPGTGKTVIALHLLAMFASKKLDVRYVTKSQPLREGVISRLPRGSRAKLLFSSPFAFLPAKIQEDAVDVMLVDEAHRLTQSANMQFTPSSQRTDMPQVETLIRAAKVCVFFIDDLQAIRSAEIGSTKMIVGAGKKFGIDRVDVVELKSQFRCNGCDNYMDWLEQVLYNRPVTSKFSKSDFDFRVYDNPHVLYSAITGKDTDGSTARLTAGFCWPWSDKLASDGDLVKDVRIADFAMPWETKSTIGNPPNGYPQWFEWAYKPMGLKQCGCIYTAQGFEFDYIGVIIGPDLRYDESSGTIVTDVTKTRDPTLRRGTGQFDTFARNIYRVLMSRGMKGCYVYCCDNALARYLRELLSAAQS